jgi:CelD/BcsL family acetyltransferase involved in cellulose biosynthesis
VTTDLATFDSIDDVAGAWADLADRVHAPPWRRVEWFRNWHGSFARDPLRIVTVEEQGRVAGLIAMELHGGEIGSAANSESPDHSFLADTRTAARALAVELVQTGLPLNLFPLPAADAVIFEEVATEAGYSLLAKPLGGSPYITVTDWDEYSATLDSKMLRELRRRRRRIEETGTLELDIATGGPGAAGMLQEFFDVEARGWKGSENTAIASDARTRAFYESWADMAESRDWLVMAALRLDGRPIAVDICLEADGVHSLLKTTFDQEWSRYSPGSLLRYMMLRRSFGSGAKSYEFLGRDEPWKKEWTTDIRPLIHLRAFPPSIRGRTRRALFGVARLVKDLGKRSR